MCSDFSEKTQVQPRQSLHLIVYLSDLEILGLPSLKNDYEVQIQRKEESLYYIHILPPPPLSLIDYKHFIS